MAHLARIAGDPAVGSVNCHEEGPTKWEEPSGYEKFRKSAKTPFWGMFHMAYCWYNFDRYKARIVCFIVKNRQKFNGIICGGKRVMVIGETDKCRDRG